MKKYEEYQDSGVDWLGEIPSHWQVKSINAITHYLSRGNAPDYNDDGKIYAVNQATFSSGTFKKSKAKPSGGIEGYETMKGRLFPGDVLLASTGGGVLGKVCHFQEDDRPYFADSHVTIIRPKPDTLGRFIYYFLSVSFDLINGVLAQGSTNQTELQSAWLKRFKWAYPPLPEQRAIAAYLDRKTAQLDTLLAQKQALLQKLHQQRQALINEAVTQGLNPAAPRKPSGVAWLGDVPAHWEVKKLKRISPRIQVGLVINPSTYFEDDGVIPMLTARHVSAGRINADNANRISLESNEKLRETQIRTGDIVVVRVGYPGIASVVPAELDGVNCASMVIIRRGNFNSEFLSYCFNSWIGQTQVDLVAYGSAQKCFNIGEAREFVFPFPSAQEQQAIVDFIEAKTGNINEAAATIHTQIRTLKAYRQSLISEVVTGKVDVRASIPNLLSADAGPTSMGGKAGPARNQLATGAAGFQTSLFN